MSEMKESAGNTQEKRPLPPAIRHNNTYLVRAAAYITYFKKASLARRSVSVLYASWADSHKTVC